MAVSKQLIVTTFHRSGRLLSYSLTLQPEHGTVVRTANTTVPFCCGDLLLLCRIGRWNVVFALKFEKGFSANKVFMRHVLKNSLNPVATSACGWLASLLAGAVFDEYVFDWKGIGYLVVQCLEKQDLPVLMGCLLIIAVMFVIINILLDIAYRALDPRVKL